MQLTIGTELQDGKYRIISLLGQGGFGITYLAEQVALRRKVAIKEFFMKQHCNRDVDTSKVYAGSDGSVKLFEHFRDKFIKEARLIAAFNNPHIIKIYDVFRENCTAYYVMEYLEGRTLKALVQENGALPEAVAVKFIRQVAYALADVHGKKLLHLDIKPSNIMLDCSGNAVLIDFGTSKHYDNDGWQTCDDGVCVSEGYAPLEQYERGALENFSPVTDIYALGATFYYILVGKKPPKASDINDIGLPKMPLHISEWSQTAIIQAMKPRRVERVRSVGDFLLILNGEEIRGLGSNGSSEDTELDLNLLAGVRPDSDATELDDSVKNRLGKHKSEETVAPVTNVFKVKDVEFKMINVEGGTFRMGSRQSVNEKEKPVHDVMLDGFFIGETEVTQALWEAVMGCNPSYFKSPDNPVVQVSYNDCIAFLERLNVFLANKLPDGRRFRLPTEAEWEYAARGGKYTRGCRYSGSDSINDVAWFWNNSENSVHPVKCKKHNELGIYDMSGNVWEWCSDYYSGSYYKCSPKENPQGPPTGTLRVLRGGSWINFEQGCRVSNRGFNNPYNCGSNYGLRLAL